MTTKMIEVQVYYTPSGAPTCANKDGKCSFLFSHIMGNTYTCNGGFIEMARGVDDGLGYLEPHKDCELHAPKKNHAACWQTIETVDTSKKVSIFSKIGGVDDCAYFQDGNWINGFDNVIIEPLFWRERVLP
jgi:hypothetical protein